MDNLQNGQEKNDEAVYISILEENADALMVYFGVTNQICTRNNPKKDENDTDHANGRQSTMYRASFLALFEEKDREVLEPYFSYDVKEHMGTKLTRVTIVPEVGEKLKKIAESSCINMMKDKSYLQEAVLRKLYDSYLAKGEEFHRRNVSAEKLEMDITISQYLSNICLDGFLEDPAHEELVVSIIDNMLSLRNCCYYYMNPLFMEKDRKPLLSLSAAEKIMRIRQFYRMLNRKDAVHIPGFSFKVIQWADKNNSDLLKILVFGDFIFDAKLWDRFLNSTYENMKLLKNKLSLFLTNASEKRKIRFAKMLGGLSKTSLMQLYGRRDKEFHTQMEYFVIQILKEETLDESELKKVSKGCMNVLDIMEPARALQILETYLSGGSRAYPYYESFMKRLRGQIAMPEKVKKKAVSPENIPDPYNKRFERLAGIYTQNGLKQYESISHDQKCFLLLGALDGINWNEEKYGRLGSLYNQVFEKLLNENGIPNVIKQKLLLADYERLHTENQHGYMQMADKTRAYIEQGGLDRISLDVLIKLIRIERMYSSDEESKTLCHVLLKGALERLVGATVQRKYFYVKMLFSIFREYTFPYTNSFFVNEQHMQIQETEFTQNMCLILRQGFLRETCLPFMEPIISSFLDMQMFYKLHEQLQIALLCYARRRNAFRKELENHFSMLESDQDNWEKLSLQMKAIYIYCLEEHREYPNAASYILNFIEKDILEKIADNQYIKKLCGKFARVEEFRIYLISWLQNAPMKTAYICMILTGRTLTAIGDGAQRYQKFKNIGNYIDVLEKLKAFRIAAGNPCIRPFVYHIAEKILELLHSGYIAADYKELVLDRELDEKMLQQIREGNFPGWFGRSYPPFSDEEAGNLQRCRTAVKISDLLGQTDLKGVKAQGRYVSPEEFQSVPKGEPYRDYRWNLTVCKDPETGKYQAVQGLTYFLDLVHIYQTSKVPVTDFVEVFAIEYAEPPVPVETKNGRKTEADLLPEQETEEQQDTKKQQDTKRQQDIKKQLEEKRAMLSFMICTLTNRGRLHNNELLSTWDFLPEREKRCCKEKLYSLASVLTFYDDIYKDIKNGAGFPTENVYAYERVLYETDMIIDRMQKMYEF